MHPTRLAIMFGAAALAANACGKRAASAPHPLSTVAGAYQFSERPAQLDQTIEGTITISRDTIIVDARLGPCRYDEQASFGKNHPVTYRCAEITLMIDRYNPIGRSSYRTTTRVYDRRTVCVRYEVNSAGQRVCAQQETQSVPRDVTLSGALHLTRVTEPE